MRLLEIQSKVFAERNHTTDEKNKKIMFKLGDGICKSSKIGKYSNGCCRRQFVGAIGGLSPTQGQCRIQRIQSVWNIEVRLPTLARVGWLNRETVRGDQGSGILKGVCLVTTFWSWWFTVESCRSVQLFQKKDNWLNKIKGPIFALNWISFSTLIPWCNVPPRKGTITSNSRAGTRGASG